MWKCLDICHLQIEGYFMRMREVYYEESILREVTESFHLTAFHLMQRFSDSVCQLSAILPNE